MTLIKREHEGVAFNLNMNREESVEVVDEGGIKTCGGMLIVV